MSLRSYVFDLLSQDEELRGRGINEKSIFLNHTKDTPQVRPLIILRWMAKSPGMGPVDQRVLQVWVHDEPGNYELIDQVLSRVKSLLRPLAGVQVGGTREWLSGVKWEGDSDDLRDDEAGTFMRNAQFRMTGSGV